MMACFYSGHRVENSCPLNLHLITPPALIKFCQHILPCFGATLLILSRLIENKFLLAPRFQNYRGGRFILFFFFFFGGSRHFVILFESQVDIVEYKLALCYPVYYIANVLSFLREQLEFSGGKKRYAFCPPLTDSFFFFFFFFFGLSRIYRININIHLYRMCVCLSVCVCICVCVKRKEWLFLKRIFVLLILLLPVECVMNMTYSPADSVWIFLIAFCFLTIQQNTTRINNESSASPPPTEAPTIIHSLLQYGENHIRVTAPKLFKQIIAI